MVPPGNVVYADDQRQRHILFYNCTNYAANCTNCAQLHTKNTLEMGLLIKHQKMFGDMGLRHRPYLGAQIASDPASCKGGADERKKERKRAGAR